MSEITLFSAPLSFASYPGGRWVARKASVWLSISLYIGQLLASVMFILQQELMLTWIIIAGVLTVFRQSLIVRPYCSTIGFNRMTLRFNQTKAWCIMVMSMYQPSINYCRNLLNLKFRWVDVIFCCRCCSCGGWVAWLCNWCCACWKRSFMGNHSQDGYLLFWLELLHA